MYRLHRKYIDFKARMISRWAVFLNRSKSIEIGSGLNCSELPNIWVTGNAKVKIGNNVTIKKGVEIRAHGDAELIIGDKTKIDDGVRIIATNTSKVEIGKNSKLGFHSVLNGGGGIKIGDNTSFYGFVYVQSSSHNFKDKSPINQQGFSHGQVEIGSNVLVGANAVILPGVKIDDSCLIGANSVVSKSIQGNNIAFGVPCKVHSKMN